MRAGPTCVPTLPSMVTMRVSRVELKVNDVPLPLAENRPGCNTLMSAPSHGFSQKARLAATTGRTLLAEHVGASPQAFASKSLMPAPPTPPDTIDPRGA